jgi:hypothetical protein
MDQVAEERPASEWPLEAASRENKPKITIKTPFAEDVYSFAHSPDGKTLVFQGTSPDGTSHPWRQAVGPSQEPAPIAGTEGAVKPDFVGQRVRGQRVNVNRALDDLSNACDQLARSYGGDLGGLRQQIADAIASAAGSILAGVPAGRG